MVDIINDERRKKRQEELLALFKGAPIKRTLGMEFHYNEEGAAVFDMPYNPSFDHALGGIHGGVIATLLDNAGWFTVAQFYDAWIATAELQVRLLKPVAKADIYSRGRILNLGKKIAMAEMEVRTKDELLIAVGSGTFAVTSVTTANTTA